MEGLKTPHQVRVIGMAHTTTTTIITERKEREKEKQKEANRMREVEDALLAVI